MAKKAAVAGEAAVGADPSKRSVSVRDQAQRHVVGPERRRRCAEDRADEVVVEVRRP